MCVPHRSERPRSPLGSAAFQAQAPFLSRRVSADSPPAGLQPLPLLRVRV
uniref:Uncharacterized protein n=1 Tax=Anguilla anguilla TaxID=7936 RepID=A0A0E9V8Z6_ANGAN